MGKKLCQQIEKMGEQKMELTGEDEESKEIGKDTEENIT